MANRSSVFMVFPLLVGVLCMGSVPSMAQAPASETVATVVEEFVVDGNEAAFIGTDPLPLGNVPDMPADNARPSGEDLSGLIPVSPEGGPSMNLPDSDADDMILPPSSGSALPFPASASVTPWPFDKSEGTEPQLIQDAEIVTKETDEDRKKERVEITGRLAIEEHPVARRRMLRRWVLKTAEGERIPLTSNYELLSAVKKAGIPDETVKVTGRWTVSSAEPRLKYLTAERFDAVASSTAIHEASGTATVASTSVDVASDTAEQ